MANSRLKIAWFIFVTLLSFVDVFIATSVKHSLTLIIYGVILMAANLYLLTHTLYFLPFHQRLTNKIVATCLSVSSIGSIVAFFSSLANSSGYGALIAFLVLSIPAGVGTFFFARYRVGLLYKPLTHGAKREIKKEYHVEICTRDFYYM